ncbi:MAG: DUF4832 domain-containing protein [Bacteroidaceae bacterium]|nr:DUF4832 domain-containing protein [Bacteroidaceae bacterium]
MKYDIKYLPLILVLWCLAAIATKAQTWQSVALKRQITHPQPMTGLVLWPEQAAKRNSTYGKSIQLEFSYCLPCKVVKGCAEDGTIEYDWSSFDKLLNEVASRGHQLVARFRYEYPSGTDVDGKKGTTAVPDYIKQRSDYNETYNEDPSGDGPTYYADWSNTELQRFTLQFYSDFAQRYAHDARIAFLEVGFGHWSEYHIYGTKVQLGVNFPSKTFQTKFFKHMKSIADGLPWLVSIDASDDTYSPILANSTLMNISFGLFDDSFMHKTHEIGTKDGYNEQCWNSIGKGTRWKKGVCGGEISYYTSSDQKNFLNPDGMYGHTWEEQAAKYHITFMIANDAPGSTYGIAKRFREASMSTGYRIAVKECKTDGSTTRLLVTNEGIAPLYRDAWFAIGEIRADKSLMGLLPDKKMWIEIPATPQNDGSDIHIVSDYILPKQEIEFNANIDGETSIQSVGFSTGETVYYNLAGQRTDGHCLGICIRNSSISQKVLTRNR